MKTSEITLNDFNLIEPYEYSIGLKLNNKKITKQYGSGLSMMPISYTVEVVENLLSELKKHGYLKDDIKAFGEPKSESSNTIE